MDFAALKKFSFFDDEEAVDETAAGPESVPAGLTVKDLTRRVGMIRMARDVIQCIPAPGESFHALMTGRYDLMVLAAVVLGQVPSVCTHLRIATLSFKKRNTHELEQ